MNTDSRVLTFPGHDDSAEQALAHLRDVLALVEWTDAVQHIARAMKLPHTNALEKPETELPADAWPRSLGHACIRDFITGSSARQGLGKEWVLWASWARAYRYKFAFGVYHEDPQSVLDEARSVAEQLGREPASISEYHKTKDQLLQMRMDSLRQDLEFRAEALRRNHQGLEQDKQALADERERLLKQIRETNRAWHQDSLARARQGAEQVEGVVRYARERWLAQQHALLGELDGQLQQARAEARAAREEARAAHENAREHVRAEHNSALEQVVTRVNEHWKHRHQAMVAELTESHEASLQALRERLGREHDAELEARARTHDTRVYDLETAVARERERIRELEADNERLGEQLARAERDYARIHRDIETIQAHRDELQQMLDALEPSRLNVRKQAIQRELKRTRNSLARMTRSRRKLRSQYLKLYRKFGTLHKRYNRSMEKVRSLQRQRDQAREESRRYASWVIVCAGAGVMVSSVLVMFTLLG